MRVRDYHRRTKHHFQRYAAGPGGLDWANQPDPFREFAGSAQTPLPLLAAAPGPSYADLYRAGTVSPQPCDLANVAAMLQLAFGLSAWKQYGDSRWALRCNPSSGNLHPTEAYLVTGGGTDLPAGVHHYRPRDHLLEQRCAFPDATAAAPLAPGVLLVGLTSIHWREAWKYGERAYRYCQHDVGHAVATLAFAAASRGWQVRLLADWGDDDVATVLGTDRAQDFADAEREHPDLMLQVDTAPAAAAMVAASGLLRAARDGSWQGRADRLSPQHGRDWPVIGEVAAACHKPRTQPARWQPPALPPPLPTPCPRDAAELIQQRRSAQAFDGSTAISSAALWRMLDMALPRGGTVPWSSIDWAPRVHLLLFVHRVDGLAPGLYLLLRNDTVEPLLRARCRDDFEWTPVAGCPPQLRLFRLLGGDARQAAKALSCHQDIAADSAFSLAMLAEYQQPLAGGAWHYRQLFWEAGMLGQVLYLEAEAAGLRGTGIGCSFDDEVHQLLGLEDEALQSLYHFTVGGALSDARLQTLPAYAHLGRD